MFLDILYIDHMVFFKNYTITGKFHNKRQGGILGFGKKNTANLKLCTLLKILVWQMSFFFFFIEYCKLIIFLHNTIFIF